MAVRLTSAQLKASAATLLLAALAFARVVSWFDHQFYLAEMLVHFTLVFALLTAICLGLLMYRRQWAPAVLAVLLLMLWVKEVPGGVNPKAVPANGTKVRFAQYNVSHILDDHRFVLDWLMGPRMRADVVALQEVTPELRQRLMGLTGRFPYQILPARGKIDLALLSRWPLTHAEVRQFPGSDINYIIADVLPPGNRTPLRVYNFHTLAPTSPANERVRNAQLDYMGRIIGEDSSPLMLLAGDFNNSPYSHYFKKLVEATKLENTMDQTGVVGTWPRQIPFAWLRLSIDNLLASKAIAVSHKYSGPRLASDHLPVVTTLTLPEDNRADAEFGLQPALPRG